MGFIYIDSKEWISFLGNCDSYSISTQRVKQPAKLSPNQFIRCGRRQASSQDCNFLPLSSCLDSILRWKERLWNWAKSRCFPPYNKKLLSLSWCSIFFLFPIVWIWFNRPTTTTTTTKKPIQTSCSFPEISLLSFSILFLFVTWGKRRKTETWPICFHFL